MRRVLPLLMLCACADDEPLDLIDTGWFDDAFDVGSDCLAQVQSSRPEAGASDWSWRDAPRLYVGDPEATYEVRLLEADGVDVPSSVVWSEDKTFVEVVPERPLRADTEHILSWTDCTGPRTLNFATSDLGLPIEDGPQSLVGRTWVLDIVGATWVQPENLGVLLSVQLEREVLVGATIATDSTIAFMGAEGDIVLGELEQNRSIPTWSLPPAPFDEAPYFESSSAQLDFILAGVAFPVTDFFLSGTFSSDGSSLGGVTLSGTADTRDAGAAVGQPGNENAFCVLASTLNAECIPCADGNPTCLVIEVEELEGVEAPGLTLQPVYE